LGIAIVLPSDHEWHCLGIIQSILIVLTLMPFFQNGAGSTRRSGARAKHVHDGFSAALADMQGELTKEDSSPVHFQKRRSNPQEREAIKA
jgi:hypothetical protein